MILAEHFRKNLREKEKKIRYISDKKVVDTENAFCYTHSCVRRKTESKKHLERYRSGHNEAVLKTVCPQGRVGSNPTLSVSGLPKTAPNEYVFRESTYLEKYPRGRRDTPGKGAGR